MSLPPVDVRDLRCWLVAGGEDLVLLRRQAGVGCGADDGVAEGGQSEAGDWSTGLMAATARLFAASCRDRSDKC